MYNEYDDEFSEEYDDELMYDPPRMQGVPYQYIYFSNGAFKMNLIDMVIISDFSSLFSFKITRVNKVPTNKTIFDIYEEFENTYLLEFLVTIIANNGIIDIGALNKIINIDASGASIVVTATISTTQDYVEIEDYLESTPKSNEIITLGNHSVLRSEQLHYCITQAVKYSILSYTSIDSGIDWTKNTIDWSIVYYNLIEPFIKSLIKISLQYSKPLNSVKEFKDYIDFNVQFAIARTKSEFYCEIYTLPKSVHGHNIYYDKTNGRRVLIGLEREGYDNDSSATSDQFRICAGTQNLNLIPINDITIKSFTHNGEFTMELNELPINGDIVFNKFILGMTQSTKLNPNHYFYLTSIEGIEHCRVNMDDKYPAVCIYHGFTNSKMINNSVMAIELTKGVAIYGVCCITFMEAIDKDLYTETIIEDDNTKLFPFKIGDMLKGAYKLPDNASFRLWPIRALPTYREYAIVCYTPDSKSDKSQSDIILKKENTTGSTHKFWPFRKRGEHNEV